MNSPLTLNFKSRLAGRYSRFLLQRIGFLLIGNAILLILIFMMIKEGGSFLEVVLRAGPNVAPTVLAGFALTVIIYTGAIDLSIGSIIVVAGTVFGVLSAQEAGPIVAFVGCLLPTGVLCSFNAWLVHLPAIPASICPL